MSTLDNAFLRVETTTKRSGGSERNEALICLAEIAAMESHIVTSYAYEEWTLITLKNGKQIDCCKKLAEIENAINVAVNS